MFANMAAGAPEGVKSGMGSNLPIHTDTIDQRRLKSATVDWLGSFRWHMAITIVWNRTVGMDRARQDLKDLLGRVDYRLVGSHYHKLRPSKRTEAVFAFEGLNCDHVHVHSLWRAPKDRWFDLGKLFYGQRGGVWNEIVQSGSYDVAACNWTGGNDEIVGYMLKQQHRFAEPQLMVWASEFHRPR